MADDTSEVDPVGDQESLNRDEEENEVEEEDEEEDDAEEEKLVRSLSVGKFCHSIQLLLTLLMVQLTRCLLLLSLFNG